MGKTLSCTLPNTNIIFIHSTLDLAPCNYKFHGITYAGNNFTRKSFRRVLQGTQSPSTKMRYCKHRGQSPVLHYWTRASYIIPHNITFGTLYLQISRHHNCTSQKEHMATKSLLKEMHQKSPPSNPRDVKPKWGNRGRQLKRGPPVKPPGTQNQGNKQQKQTCNIWIALPPRAELQLDCELQQAKKELFASDTVAINYTTSQDAHPKHQQIIGK